MEAMKMEHSILAPCVARVARLAFALGDQVAEAAVLVQLDPLEADASQGSGQTDNG